MLPLELEGELIQQKPAREPRMEPRTELLLPATRFHSRAALPKHGSCLLTLPRWT